MPSRPLTAVLWDFDGTLADTRARNYQVVRRVIADATGKPADHLPALRSREAYDRVNHSYANWRDLYTREFGFSEEETDRVGRLWTEYQLADQTPAPVFRGVRSALAALAGIPWLEDVDIRRQKPEPDGIHDHDALWDRPESDGAERWSQVRAARGTSGTVLRPCLSRMHDARRRLPAGVACNRRCRADGWPRQAPVLRVEILNGQ